jgi:hypothetical protein
LLTLRPQSPDAGRGADAERKGGGLFLILNVFPRLRDVLSLGFLIKEEIAHAKTAKGAKRGSEDVPTFPRMWE